jgi:hypothetical protein
VGIPGEQGGIVQKRCARLPINPGREGSGAERLEQEVMIPYLRGQVAWSGGRRDG